NATADNTTAGDGQCTLREAIANVNAAGDTSGGDCVAGTGGGDMITFALTLPATIKLQSAQQLTIGQNVSIVGPTTGLLSIQGRRSRVFEISAGSTSMSSLAIRRGWGSGILVDAGASLALDNCTLSRNTGGTAPIVGGGGAITNSGTVTLTNCTISGNS